MYVCQRHYSAKPNIGRKYTYSATKRRLMGLQFSDDSDLKTRKLSDAAHLADEFTAVRRANKGISKRNFPNHERSIKLK